MIGVKKRKLRMIRSFPEKCPKRDSNPHVLLDTCPSNMPVYQFQHPGGIDWVAKIIIWWKAGKPRFHGKGFI
jgi:hypothetical protein